MHNHLLRHLKLDNEMLAAERRRALKWVMLMRQGSGGVGGVRLCDQEKMKENLNLQ